MPTYIALLRGINVGGNRIIPMADLRTIVAGAGARDVQTYIQSGNVVFGHGARSAARLTADLERAIEAGTGFDVRVVVRTAAELGAVIAANPFRGADADHLHVSFLAARPAAGALAPIAAATYRPERFALVERELYLCLPGGLGNSKLAGAITRLKAIAPIATTRNWRTIEKLHALASG